MKIAHVVRRLSFGDWGGTEQVVWNLAKAQRAAGHVVRIFATDALGGVGEETRDGLEVRRFPCLYPWWPMPERVKRQLDLKGGNPFVPGLGRTLREWGADVIHCHAMGRMAELCIRTAEGTGAKSVASLHGGAAKVPEAEARELRAPTRGRLPWGKAVEVALGWRRRVPEDADGIVCVGEDEAEYWKRLHGKVLWLPNGVDCGVFGKAADGIDRVDKSEKIDGRKVFRVLCVARIDRQKNQMMLVEALGRHPRMVVRLVGPTTQPDYLEALRDRARELGSEGRLEVAGALPPDSPELAAEFGRADAFVLPSRHEPFGIAVLEAWSAGVPVIAAKVGGLKYLVREGENGRFCDPADPSTIVAAVDAYRRNNDMRQIAARARIEAQDNYSWKKISGRLADFYREVINGHR